MPKLANLLQQRKAASKTPPARPLTARLTALDRLLGRVAPVPVTWLKTAIKAENFNDGDQSLSVSTISCDSHSDLVKSWRDAMEWFSGLDEALAVMLASSMSTPFVGEQLWIKIIGPPSCGKTSIMEGLATATDHYVSRDSIRGFYSGYKSKDGEGKPALADEIMGKTLGTKDGDTLLKAPNLKQILSEGRALYDRVSRTHYRNTVSSVHIGRMTWHLAGTAALREIDDSELGARFLDVVVMDKIEDRFENEVGRRAAMQEARNMLLLSDGKPESRHPEDLAKAMGMSGGYLRFLRENALDLARRVSVDDYVLEHVSRFGKFIAFMRARDSGESSEREFSARLVKQITRLSIALGAVLQKDSVDEEVVSRVHKVTMDTSRGFTLELVKSIGKHRQGMEVRGIAARLHTGDDSLRKQLRFLRKIGVVEVDKANKRWRVTDRIYKLFKEVEVV